MAEATTTRPAETPLVVEEQFRGPPMSGNGGYVCGLVADRMTQGRHDLANDQAAEVTLRSPVPLDTEMTAVRSELGLQVMYGDKLVAEATMTELTMTVPAPPSWDAALAARDQSPSMLRLHADRLGVHPICFCCGAELSPEQGLRVFAAAVPGFDGVAAAWQPHERFGDADGWLPATHIWTALDCPGMCAFMAQGTRVGLLGRMAARIIRPVNVHDRNLVIGWSMGVEGRKHFAGTAIYNERGELCAYARSTWIGGTAPRKP